MQLVYVRTMEKYLSEYGSWTDEDLDMMADWEKAWRATQRKQSFASLLETYPQAKPLLRKFLKETIRQCEDDLAQASLMRASLARRQADWMCDPATSWLPHMVYEVLHIEPLEDGRLKKLKEARYYLSLLVPRSKQDVFDESNAVEQRGVTPAQIEAARAVPIDSLMDFSRNHKGLCVFHNEKTPSMHLFPDNHVHCFSCGGGGDAISVIRAMREIGFTEAVRALLTQ